MALGLFCLATAQTDSRKLYEQFAEPSSEAQPWIFWYWMNGAVTEEGITADLEAMKSIGLEGAYLMPIRDSSRVQFMDECTLQGTEKWWKMVEFSMKEADRLGLKMGMHICDGFALAGGPWITPEESMQKVVYTQTVVPGGKYRKFQLPEPQRVADYYEDIAVYAVQLPDSFAFAQDGKLVGTALKPASVKCSDGSNVAFLPEGRSKLKVSNPVDITYAYDEPVTVRSMSVSASGTNFQAYRWTVSASQDGVDYEVIKVCEPARRGWQDTDAGSTYTLPETTARFFRFHWSPEGTEPGAEDLDAAKWAATLSLSRLQLHSFPLMENFEGKSGLLWRLSPRLTEVELPDNCCLPLENIQDITSMMASDGSFKKLKLKKNSQWLLLRMGHTSTGHQNDTGGGAKGLECDKFDADAVRSQFDHWFGAAWKHIDPALLGRTLVRLHSDSWECGSQNWSKTFRDEFKSRRGYDLMPYMPLYAGLPLVNAATSEAVLYDIRLTISELVRDVFFTTLHDLAQQYGCEFSSECVAPTMMSDGLLHYGTVERPMGEYWLDSPTHDKPNDMFDAVSGAHIYGKNIVQAEGFTQLRALWKEYPGMLKSLGDRNLAFGMNKLFFHVFCHHPFPGMYPGMTLDGIGLYMQGNQTWWPYASEWIDYFKRCQAMLQYGHPVTDIAVFTGEALPSRSILPDRLVQSLPGLFGEERVLSEQKRVANEGQPTHSTSVGVKASANMVTADLWDDPLRGYRYDCINPDALVRLAKAENGRMVLPGGASYKVFVWPMPHPMSPDTQFASYEVLSKIKELQDGGVVVLLPPTRPTMPVSANVSAETLQKMDYLSNLIWEHARQNGCILPYMPEDLNTFGLERDFSLWGENEGGIVWNHRSGDEAELWFVANLKDEPQSLLLTIRTDAADKEDFLSPEIWNPVDGSICQTTCRKVGEGIRLALSLEANASCFVVLPKKQASPEVEGNGYAQLESGKMHTSLWHDFRVAMRPWDIRFEKADTTLTQVKKFFDWRSSEDTRLKYYAGTAVYSTTLTCDTAMGRLFMYLEDYHIIARVFLNGQDCGVLWTEPGFLDVTDAMRSGENRLEIHVANTWYNYSQAINYGILKDENYWTNGRTWDFKPGKMLSVDDLQPSGLLTMPHFFQYFAQ